IPCANYGLRRHVTIRARSEDRGEASARKRGSGDRGVSRQTKQVADVVIAGFRIGYRGRTNNRFTETSLIDKVDRYCHGDVIVERAHRVESRSGAGTKHGVPAYGQQGRLVIVRRALRTKHR